MVHRSERVASETPTAPPPSQRPDAEVRRSARLATSTLHPVPAAAAPEPKRQRTARAPAPSSQRELVPPSVWYDSEVARELWLPARKDLRHVSKQSGRGGVVAPLLTSWFGVTNFTEEERVEPQWVARRVADQRELDAELRQVGDVADGSAPINSVVKLKLYPTQAQRLKLDQMFAAHRGVFNMAVAQSWKDCLPFFVKRPQNKNTSTVQTRFLSPTELSKRYQSIASTKDMHKFFRNKRALARHLEVPYDVRQNAFRDFIKAVRSSRALFFALRAKGKATTFPELTYKSKYARSDTIELSPKAVKFVKVRSESNKCTSLVRIFPAFFGYPRVDAKGTDGKGVEGIKVVQPLPELVSSIRLQRLREGDYFLVVPRSCSWDPQISDRVCAIDPGVRQFLTLYDPRGRTLSVDDPAAALKRRFEVIDLMKSELASLVNASKSHHIDKISTREKVAASAGARRKKTALHRHRYRLRRRIRYANRRVTRMVHDMHQKVTSWLAANYRCVLLPSFQTAEMVRQYEREETADGTPATSADEGAPPAQAPQDVSVTKTMELPTSRPRRRKRERVIRSPTARAMLLQAHYKFKELLRYKMARVGGRLIDCEEEYTSKTCSLCGAIHNALGGKSVFECPACQARVDRDVNAARNILHKNRDF